MAGILDFTGTAPRGGVLGGLNDNAMLGYLAGAFQGGNLGQSIGHGLAGWLAGERLDQQRLAPAQTYRALAEAGVPDAMAKAAALNPQIMKAVAPAYFGREPFNDVTSVNGVIGRLGDLMTAADRSAGIAPAGASFEPQTPALADFARARGGCRRDGARAALGRHGRGRHPRLERRAGLIVLRGSAAMGRGIELVNARLADLQARYRRGATAPPELLSPKSKATLGKLQRWTAPAGGER